MRVSGRDAIALGGVVRSSALGPPYLRPGHREGIGSGQRRQERTCEGPGGPCQGRLQKRRPSGSPGSRSWSQAGPRERAGQAEEQPPSTAGTAGQEVGTLLPGSELPPPPSPVGHGAASGCFHLPALPHGPLLSPRAPFTPTGTWPASQSRHTGPHKSRKCFQEPGAGKKTAPCV